MLQDRPTIDGKATYSVWFVFVVAIFITCLITANIAGVKLVEVFRFVLPAGTIIFPVSYIFGDVLTEVYGYRQARRVIWLGFFCNFIVVVAIWIGQVLPPASFWDGQKAYERILGYTPRLLVASFLAYLVGEFANSFVLAKMKVVTQGRWLWTRTIGSTLVGEGLDSLVFMTLAFAGTMPAGGLLSAILTQWLVKSAYEAVVTPLTYIVVNFLKRKEGLDVFDYDTRYGGQVELQQSHVLHDQRIDTRVVTVVCQLASRFQLGIVQDGVERDVDARVEAVRMVHQFCDVFDRIACLVARAESGAADINRIGAVQNGIAADGGGFRRGEQFERLGGVFGHHTRIIPERSGCFPPQHILFTPVREVLCGLQR